jgi:hypothetical protein
MAVLADIEARQLLDLRGGETGQPARHRINEDDGAQAEKPRRRKAESRHGGRAREPRHRGDRQ